MSDARDKTPKAQDGKLAPSGGKNETMPPASQLDLEFHPIEIQGEPLSATIIRERQERPY